MKKYIYRLFIVFLATVALSSCTEEEGSVPGNDSKPVVTVYQYKASRPLNIDNDILVRFAANNKTTEAYYLVEKTADRNDHIAALGESGYNEYVVSNGTKLSTISGESDVLVTVTDLYGEYTITAVAVGGGIKTSATTSFTGLAWEDVVSGTYHFFKPSIMGDMVSTSTTLQICTTDENLYRFKDLYGTGYHLKINLIDLKGTDEDGEYTFFRIPATDTPFTYNNGIVNVRDIGYWQGSDAWVTERGYESGMYSDYSCFLFIQYYYSGGNLGYNYDMFIPD